MLTLAIRVLGSRLISPLRWTATQPEGDEGSDGARAALKSDDDEEEQPHMRLTNDAPLTRPETDETIGLLH